MEKAHLQAVLTLAGAKEGKDGWWEVSEGKSLTFYAAHQGVSLTISRGAALRMEGPLVSLRTNRGETFVVSLESLFAGAVEGTAATTRKAGFL